MTRHGIPSHVDNDADFYPTPLMSIADRVGQQRCVGCACWVVDAYFCYDCAITSRYTRADDLPASTAKAVSRRCQERVDRAAAYEQWINLQTVGSIAEAMRVQESPQHLTADEHLRITRIIGSGGHKKNRHQLRLEARRAA